MEPSARTLYGSVQDFLKLPDFLQGWPAHGAGSDPNRIGRFVVIKRIDQGGMGVIYAAYDDALDRKVAIKLLRAGEREGSSASDGRTRLLREAQALAKLSHPNVIPVYEAGEEDGAKHRARCLRKVSREHGFEQAEMANRAVKQMPDAALVFRRKLIRKNFQQRIQPLARREVLRQQAAGRCPDTH